MEPALEGIEVKFGNKPEVVKANHAALRAGYNFADTIELFADAYSVRPAELPKGKYRNITDNRPNLALADFVAPADTGIEDYLGAFAVTTGLGLDDLVADFERDHDDYRAIMAKALADRLAESFAEQLHRLVRREWWGYAQDEGLGNEGLIHEEYQGIRPAPGYPACPDHTEKRTVFDLLHAETRAEIRLTENFAMLPAASVSGYYFWHPEAAYFGLGRIERDQVEDYARRKRMEPAAAERWLAPSLNYQP